DIVHDGIQEQFGKKILPFVDFDEQRYQLISDENNSGVPAGVPWPAGPIPLEYAITGLGPIVVRSDNYESFKEILEKVFVFKEIAQEDHFYLFEMGEGGYGAQVVLEHNTELPQAMHGAGTEPDAPLR